MNLLASREYPVIDYQTMAEFIGHERLFRCANGAFLLHMSSEGPEAEERIIWLTARDAITWLNEAPDQFGSLWEIAKTAPAVKNFPPPRRELPRRKAPSAVPYRGDRAAGEHHRAGA